MPGTRQFNAERTTWVPFLDGPVAISARSSIERVVDVLLEDVRSPGDGFDLSRGSAGRALAFVYLADCLRRTELRDAARSAWEATLDGLAASDSEPSLYGGFSGPAWVAAHLGPRLDDDANDDSVHEMIESALVAHIETLPRYENYDLIAGLVGIGLYALERWPSGESPRILELVVRRLVSLGERVDGGITWRTPPTMLPAYQVRQAPEGYSNLGLAHGIPGVIALLARAGRVGALPRSGVHALEGGVEWLLGSQRPLRNGLRYVSWMPVGMDISTMDAKGSRLAWCYGDLGVAAALLVAGDCHQRTDWRHEAVALARSCAAVSPSESGVADHGLCHGAAGVGLLFARMAHTTGDPVLRDAARLWLAKTLEWRMTTGPGIDGYASWEAEQPDAEPEHTSFRYVRAAGLLTGACGVALALAAGFAAEEPAWDRMLLVSS